MRMARVVATTTRDLLRGSARARSSWVSVSVRRYLLNMLVVAQQPIIDVRGMVRDTTGRIRAPDWKWLPVHEDEFVRGLGSIKERWLKGVQPWSGEAYFVDAAQTLRFESTAQWCNSLGGAFQPVFRRYFSDGTVGRLEIGLRTPRRLGPKVDCSPAAIAIDAMSLSMRLGDDSPVPFVEMGPRFAQFLLEATTLTDTERRPPALETWWVLAGSPLVVCELAVDEIRSDAAAATPSQLAGSRGGALIEHRWLTVARRRVSLWFVVAGPTASPDVMRRLRVHISRMHAEHEAFRVVLRLCDNEQLDIGASGEVRSYINERAGLLLRRQFAGFPQRDLLELVLDDWETAYQDDLTTMRSVEAKLSSVGLSRKVAGVAALTGTTDPGSEIKQLILVEEGGVLHMSDDHSIDQSVSISGNTGQIAGVQGGAGNQQEIDSIAQTINNLPALAEELLKTISEIRGQLPDQDVDEATDNAQVILDEANKPKPDTGKINRFLDRITKWAKAAGPPALSVLSVASQIAAVVAVLA